MPMSVVGPSEFLQKIQFSRVDISTSTDIIAPKVGYGILEKMEKNDE